MSPPIPSLDAVVAARARLSYRYFFERAWRETPRLASVPFVPNWHVDAMCDHLQAVAKGQIRNLLINVGPRSTKTEIVSVFFLPWVWTWAPHKKGIFASLTRDNAIESSVFSREIVEQCEWYQRLFVRGEWELRDDKNVKHDFANTKGGGRFSTSVGATVIGRGAHYIVGDDLQDDEGAQSETECARTIRYWDGTLSSRADDPEMVSKIIVQQRLGKRDLSAHAIASGRYTHLCLPTRYNPKRPCVTVINGKEWRDPRIIEGELLNPKRLGPAGVADALTPAVGMGPAKFKTQHDQDPDDETGGEFKRIYWRFYIDPRYKSLSRPEGCLTEAEAPAIPLPPKFTTKILSMDTAVKEKQQNDWTVIGALGSLRASIFLLDVDRQKRDIMGMISMLAVMMKLHPDARQKYIEDKASGSPILQMLRNGMPALGEIDLKSHKGGDPLVLELITKGVPGLVPVDPKGSKTERARAGLPRIEAGQVYLPQGAPWVEAFVAEHASFPNGTYDDQVDMLSQGLLKIAIEKQPFDKKVWSW